MIFQSMYQPLFITESSSDLPDPKSSMPV